MRMKSCFRSFKLQIIAVSGNHDSASKLDAVGGYCSLCDRIKIIGNLPLALEYRNGCFIKTLRTKDLIVQLKNADGTGTWRFAEHQYDFMGDGPSSGTNYQGNVTVAGYSKYNASADLDVARDLFGWGTSGYNNKYPYMTSTSSGSYYSGSMVDDGANYDWGVYHSASGSSTDKITNGGNYAWRLWTSEEMSYVMKRTNKVYTRDDYMENKKLFCYTTLSGVTTNDIKGMIIFPDGWTGNFIKTIKYASGSYDNNVFNADQWAMLEGLGCIFLPAAHTRDGVSISYKDEGHYWTSTVFSVLNNTEYRGGCLEFWDGSSLSSATNDRVRNLGQSVRLIRDVE